jgi:putative ABC transport system substrate-binding protein
MRRRTFIEGIAALGVAWPLAAGAQQQAGKIHRIGLLTRKTDASVANQINAFRHGLRDLGWVEGTSISIEYRDAEGRLDRLRALAAELVALNMDVIVTVDTPPTQAAKQATSTIPIVVAVSADPVGAGLVSSLAHPGGNTTGLTLLAPEAALWDPTTGKAQVKESENAARSMNLNLQVLEVPNREAISSAFAAARDGQAQAINVFASPVLASLNREIITLAAEYRLPAIYQWREAVEAGGLLSYGADLASMWRQSGVIVGRILKGERPTNLPIQQPARFELAVNAKTAMSLKVAIPPSTLVRADAVID